MRRDGPENAQRNAEAKQRTTQADQRNTTRPAEGTQQIYTVRTSSLSLNPQAVVSPTPSWSRQHQGGILGAITLEKRSNCTQTPEETERNRQELGKKIAIWATAGKGKIRNQFAGTAVSADGESAGSVTITATAETNKTSIIFSPNRQFRTRRYKPWSKSGES